MASNSHPFDYHTHQYRQTYASSSHARTHTHTQNVSRWKKRGQTYKTVKETRINSQTPSQRTSQQTDAETISLTAVQNPENRILA